MTAATFILIHKQPKDPAAAAEALKFFAWAYSKGGKMAEDLDYVPMPAKVVGTIEDIWSKNIKDAGGKPLYTTATEDRRESRERRPWAPFPISSVAVQLARRLQLKLNVAASLPDMPAHEPGEPEMHEPGRKPVVDLALSRGDAAAAEAASRSKILGRLRFSDTAFRHLTRGAAILVLVILGGVIICR